MQGAREAELSKYTSTPPDLARDVPVENREEIDAGKARRNDVVGGRTSGSAAAGEGAGGSGGITVKIGWGRGD